MMFITSPTSLADHQEDFTPMTQGFFNHQNFILMLPQRTDPDYAGNVVSNCSFSKFFSPGIRLGWMEAPYKVRKLLHSSGVALSGGGFNHVMSMIMNSVISLGHLDEIVEENRAVLKVTKNKSISLELFIFGLVSDGGSDENSLGRTAKGSAHLSAIG